MSSTAEEETINYCDKLSNILHDFYILEELTDHGLVVILIVISIVCSGLSIYTLRVVPGIQDHPMKIIEWI